MMASLPLGCLSIAGSKTPQESLGHDLQIKPGRHIPRVVNIVLDPVSEGGFGVSLHLPESGEPRAHGKTKVAPEGVIAHFIHGEGARSDQTHVAAHHIPQLWNLIQVCSPEKPPHPSDPRVYGEFEHWSIDFVARSELLFQFLGVHYHGAKLVHGEWMPAPTTAALTKNNRAWGVQLDRKGNEKHDRRERCQRQSCHCHIENALS